MHALKTRHWLGWVGAAASVFVACARPARTEQATLEPGRLATSWYAGGSSCANTPQFRVHPFNNDFFILRQAACTNYEKPFLYLIFGNERALLLDTGAGGV